MPFSEFVGQPHIVGFLQKALAAGKLNHALLFSGPAGSGKATLALLLAQAVNCTSGEDRVPCGTCLSCRKTASGNHPDVRFIAREGAHIKIEQARTLRQEAALPPYEGQKKVYIVDGAEDMTVPAANSLLKILEDPPPYLLFLLLSSRPRLLLPTLVSRCQVLPFRPVPEEEIASFLLRHTGDMLPGEARTFASLAQGSVGKALLLHSDREFIQVREKAAGFLQEIREAGEDGAFDLAEAWAELKDPGLFLDLTLLYLRDALLYKRSLPPGKLYFADFETSLQRTARMPERSLLEAVRAILAARKELAVPVNQKLALGVLLLELKEVI
jgi:DNA polymerase III subunit delta'